MTIKKILYVLSGLLFLISGAAFAQPVIDIGDGEGAPGDPVTIDMNWATDGNDIVGLQFEWDFDLAVLTFVSCTLNEPYASYDIATCRIKPADPEGDLIEVGLLDGVTNPQPIPSGAPIGTVQFTINGGASAGTTDLVLGFTDLGPGAPAPTLDDGVVTVLGPAYSSAPTPAQGVDLGSVVQGGTDPTAPVLVTNTGAAGTTLTVTGCSITSNASMFSVDSEAQFTVDEGSAGVTRTVSCRASGAIQVHNGVMTCNHDGGAAGEATPAVYALTCNITAGPQPAYSSIPAAGTPIAMGPVEQGDPITPVDVAISNSGDAGTTLTGTCGITGGDGRISVADGAFSVLQGGASDIQTVSCDSSAEGNYAATLTCEHDGSNPTATYAVTCDVGPAGGAIFRSDPMPGSTTPIGVDVLVGDPAPTSPLAFFNDADPGNMDLEIACSKTAGDAEITVAPDISGGISIAPQSSSGVTFSCDTAGLGSFSATYTCDYTVDGTSLPTGNGGIQQAIYTYTCDVRDAISDVSEDPESGETLTTVVATGGTGSFQVTFTEDADEGVDGELITCALDVGSVFSITSPDSFPVDISASDPVVVTVEGTDPGGADIIQDVLTCTYSDSGSESTDAVYNLVMQIGEVATFTVFKDFADENPNAAPVVISCDNGLPIRADSDVREGLPVTFVVGAFESGELNCEIFESPTPDGYMASFEASGDSVFGTTDTSCVFTTVDRGNENFCTITNTPKPVDVVITKDWLIEGTSSDYLNIAYELTLYCDAVIVDGFPYLNGETSAPASLAESGVWYKPFDGIGLEIFTAEVIPGYPSSDCYVVENVFDDTVETENNCGNLVVSAGHGDSCTVINTVFFEGIPTLSQYGLAILALLMLAVGMVGFRRFT